MGCEEERRRTMSSVVWNKPQRITLGVNGEACRTIMDEWLYRQAPVTMTVRRARTEGMGCIIMDVEQQRTQRPCISQRGASTYAAT